MNKEKVKEIIENKLTTWKEKIECLSSYLKELEDKYQNEENPYNYELREFEIKAVDDLFYKYSQVNKGVHVFNRDEEYPYTNIDMYIEQTKKGLIHNITELGMSKRIRISKWLKLVALDFFDITFRINYDEYPHSTELDNLRKTFDNQIYSLEMEIYSHGYRKDNYPMPYILYYDYLLDRKAKGLGIKRESQFSESHFDHYIFCDFVNELLLERPWHISTNISKWHNLGNIFFNATIEEDEVDIWRVFKCYRAIHKPSIAVDETINCLNKIIKYNIDRDGLHPLFKLENYDYYSG